MRNSARTAACIGLVATALLAAPAMAYAEVINGVLVDDVATYGGHTYYRLGLPSSWTEAEAAGVLLGGHLATINDLAEQQFVVTTFRPQEGHLWIGLHDPEPGEAGIDGSSAEWVWASGEITTFRDWLADEPNNFFLVGDEDFVMILSAANSATGQWNDYKDASTFQFGGTGITGVVEVDSIASEVPEPGTLTLAGVALVALRARRRRVT
jgi:uncharacterized protein (TIGR03382 family)